MSNTTMVAPVRRDIPTQSQETRDYRRPLILSALLLGIFVLYSWLAVNWAPFVRWDALLNRNFHVHPWWPELHFFDRVGQRVLILRPLAVIAVIAAWWLRSWRPVILAVFGVFMLNLMVLIVKLWLSRGDPLSGESFFGDGDLYPSGHTSNIVVVYGLCYYLLIRSWSVPRWLRRSLFALLCLLCLIQFTTSILLRWHWFSDLIGGYLIGGSVLALAVALDVALSQSSGKARWLARRRRRSSVPSLIERRANGSSPEPASTESASSSTSSRADSRG